MRTLEVGSCCGLTLTLVAGSYDLDLDKRLSEETTVLVENYEVR